MNRITAALVAAFFMAVGVSSAHAQGVGRICLESIGANGSNNCVDVSSSNPFPTVLEGGGSIIGYVNILGGTGAIMDTTPGGTAAPNALQVQGVAGGTPAKASADPCAYSNKTNVPISTASGTTALVAGVTNQKIYICSLFVKAGSAVAASLAEGSSSTCGTSNQAAVIGVATNGTAANGVPLTTYDGWVQGDGTGTIARTATNANYLCLFQSSTVQLSGNLTYVQQ